MMLRTSDRSKDTRRRKILRKRNEILRGLRKELNEGISKGPELKASVDSDLGDLSAMSLDSYAQADRSGISKGG